MIESLLQTGETMWGIWAAGAGLFVLIFGLMVATRGEETHEHVWAVMETLEQQSTFDVWEEKGLLPHRWLRPFVMPFMFRDVDVDEFASMVEKPLYVRKICGCGEEIIEKVERKPEHEISAIARSRGPSGRPTRGSRH